MKKLKLFIFLSILVYQLGYAKNEQRLIDLIDNNNLSDFQSYIDTLDNLNFVIKDRYTVLCYCLDERKIEFTKALIDKGADIEQICRGKTPLMYSSKNGNFEILKYLLHKGVDINRKVNGRDAIQYAYGRGNIEAIKFFEEHGTTKIGFDSEDGPYLLFNDIEAHYHLIRIDSLHQLVLDTLFDKPEFLTVDFPNKKGVHVNLKPVTNEKKCIHPMPEKLFAISDIEGNYDKLYKALLRNKIIDNNLNWKFGQGHLVLVGDFVDRGKNVAAILWLIYKLEQEAVKAGGYVHFILGNHEVMNMQGKNGSAHGKYHLMSLRTKKKMSDFYSKNAELGKWLRSKNTIEKIGKHLFVHAGISDSLLAIGLPINEMNELARKNFDTPESSYLADLILNRYGILWYRGLVRDYKNYEKVTETSIDNILSQYFVNDIIVGHCVVDDISTDYNNKVIRIDIKHEKTESAGIMIEDEKIFKVIINGERKLLNEMNANRK